MNQLSGTDFANYSLNAKLSTNKKSAGKSDVNDESQEFLGLDFNSLLKLKTDYTCHDMQLEGLDFNSILKDLKLDIKNLKDAKDPYNGMLEDDSDLNKRKVDSSALFSLVSAVVNNDSNKGAELQEVSEDSKPVEVLLDKLQLDAVNSQVATQVKSKIITLDESFGQLNDILNELGTDGLEGDISSLKEQIFLDEMSSGDESLNDISSYSTVGKDNQLNKIVHADAKENVQNVSSPTQDVFKEVQPHVKENVSIDKPLSESIVQTKVTDDNQKVVQEPVSDVVHKESYEKTAASHLSEDKANLKDDAKPIRKSVPNTAVKEAYEVKDVKNELVIENMHSQEVEEVDNLKEEKVEFNSHIKLNRKSSSILREDTSKPVENQVVGRDDIKFQSKNAEIEKPADVHSDVQSKFYETMKVDFPEEIPYNLAKKIIENSVKGKREFEIQIEPKNLGKISVKVEYKNGESVFSIICTEAKTLEIVKKNVQDIRMVLEKNLQEEPVVFVDEKKASEFFNEAGDDSNARRESEWERHREKRRRESRESGNRFLQELRLGLRV